MVQDRDSIKKKKKETNRALKEHDEVRKTFTALVKQSDTSGCIFRFCIYAKGKETSDDVTGESLGL